MYVSMVYAFIFVFIVTALGTLFVDALFRFLGKRGFLGNLFPNVRGGIPRGVGIVPFIVLSFYLLPGYNDLVLIIGICAFIDDVFGRRKFSFMNIEIGQFPEENSLLIFVLLVAGFCQVGKNRA